MFTAIFAPTDISGIPWLHSKYMAKTESQINPILDVLLEFKR